ncbi:MAG: FAD-binding protein [Chloroflexi bacterium]|nr:FAD-binding protein [Chloroflexota bacterium]
MDGAALSKCLSDAVQKRGIPVMWATPATHLVRRNGEVRGVAAGSPGNEVAIRARRAD